MLLSKQELLSSVPIIEKDGLLIVRLKDIPNPYRSEFASDLYGSCRPIFEDETWSFYAHDWDVWLRNRFKKDYSVLYPSQYKLLTDADVDCEPMNTIVQDIEVQKSIKNCLYIEKTEDSLMIKFNDIVYFQKEGDTIIRDSNNILADECIEQIHNIFNRLEGCYIETC